MTRVRAFFTTLPRSDRVILGICCLITLASFSLWLFPRSGSELLIYSGERLIYKLPLTEDRELELTGPLGVTLLEVADRSVRVVSSPCRDKTCMRMGHIEHAGELLACVPNRIVVRIAGPASAETEYDLLSR